MFRTENGDSSSDRIRSSDWLIVSPVMSGATIGSGINAMGILFVAWSRCISHVVGILLARPDISLGCSAPTERRDARVLTDTSRSGLAGLTGGSFDMRILLLAHARRRVINLLDRYPGL